ncbi:hypothetical protein D3C77_385870 [compost metagenome]
MQVVAQIGLHLLIQMTDALAQMQPHLLQVHINPPLGIQPRHRLLAQGRQAKAPGQELAL